MRSHLHSVKSYQNILGYLIYLLKKIDDTIYHSFIVEIININKGSINNWPQTAVSYLCVISHKNQKEKHQLNFA